MKKKYLLAKLVLAALGLLATNTLLAVETTPSNSNDADLVKTTKVFDGFKVELAAPASVDAQQLLNTIPIDLKYSQEVFSKVSELVDKLRLKLYPDASISLDVSRLGEKTATKATSGNVTLYTVITRWNYAVNYNGQMYAYNYNKNTAVCFARAHNGSWYGQVQYNGSWTNVGYVYAGGVQHMYSTGYDNYKGCNWWGKASYNKGDFIMYFFD